MSCVICLNDLKGRDANQVIEALEQEQCHGRCIYGNRKGLLEVLLTPLMGEACLSQSGLKEV